MSTFAAILWGLAIFAGLLACYVAFISPKLEAKTVTVTAKLDLWDKNGEVCGNVEVTGGDPGLVADAVTAFEDRWVPDPVKVDMDGIEPGDVNEEDQ